MIFGKFKMKEPQRILGGRFIDDRGFLKALIFPEGFTPKRLYSVNNWRVNFIRAWHGHQFESKLIYMSKGAGIVAAVHMSDPIQPDKSAPVTRFVIDSESHTAIYIPAGYANGLMSLTSDAEFTVISSASLEESKADDFRFPFDYWKAWDIEQR
jgi:dTDP-4-dehydrorhamnose 3,5-epimerase-like enzyme